eukprot:872585_1
MEDCLMWKFLQDFKLTTTLRDISRYTSVYNFKSHISKFIVINNLINNKLYTISSKLLISQIQTITQEESSHTKQSDKRNTNNKPCLILHRNLICSNSR